MQREREDSTPPTPTPPCLTKVLLQILTKRAVHQGRAKGYNELLDELLTHSFSAACKLCIYLQASHLNPTQRLVLFKEDYQSLETVLSDRILLETWSLDSAELTDSYPEHILQCYLNYLPAFGLFQRLKRNLPLSNNQLLSLEFTVEETQTEEQLNSESVFIAAGITCTYTKNVAFRVKRNVGEQQQNYALLGVTGMDENYFSKESAFSMLGAPWTLSAGQQQHFAAAGGHSPMPSLFRNPSSLSNRDRLVSVCPLMVGEEEKEIEKFISCCQELLAGERGREFVEQSEAAEAVIEPESVRRVLYSFLNRE